MEALNVLSFFFFLVYEFRKFFTFSNQKLCCFLSALELYQNINNNDH